MSYQNFIERKSQLYDDSGFKPNYIPDYLFDFEKYLVEKIIRKGRILLSADCGLGKTIMELVYAQNIVNHTNKNVLLLTPLSVSGQTLNEANKFGIECSKSNDGNVKTKITITNYEKLHMFNRNDFICIICDESSILKNFNGKRKKEITEFMKKMPYRLLATATAAPNDWPELGTSSEALGYMGFVDMLSKYFKNENNTSSLRRHFGEAPKWRFRNNAEIPFWRWVTSWAIALRKPSDLGFEDNGFILPKLSEKMHIIDNVKPKEGFLFDLPANRLDEQRDEVKRTTKERCEFAASLVNNTGKPALIGCHTNDESRLLKEIVKDSVEISGSDSDDRKEEKFDAFLNGDARNLIIKAKMGAWGLNFQHCSHIVYFPSHSYEMKYQFVRRCWRYGQKNQVDVDYVMTPGLIKVMENLNRKSKQADRMFNNLIKEMNNAIDIKYINQHTKKETLPSWL